MKPVSTREIPLSRPYLDEREEELVLEVLRSGRLSLGPTIDASTAAGSRFSVPGSTSAKTGVAPW